METRPLTAFFQAGPIASADVVGCRIVRRLGIPAAGEIAVRSPTYAEPDGLLGLPARVTLGRGESAHELPGIVTRVTLVSSPEDDDRSHVLYRIQVSSLLALLEREVDCRIFQDKDVKEIVTQVLADLGIDGTHQSWHLTGVYPKREYCVQYSESALAFVSRLLEEEGIYFYSETSDEGEIVVFEDDSTLADPIDGEEELRYLPASGLEATDDAIGVITQRHRTATGKVVLRDYDFEKPQLDMTVSVTASKDTDLEIYDYPGLYTDVKEGARLAQVRLEALQAERQTLELESGCVRLSAGRWIKLVDTPDELDGEYLITGAIHELELGVYRVTATAIPRAVKFRTAQRTPAPVIDGPQTAQIVAPAGSPPESVHTDAHGRCKVRFHWDTYGETDDTASCWIRVSQLQTSGSMILPRVGWEVIVEFLEGNPDRPIITGRVYNGHFKPPYALPEGKSRTSLGSSSSPGGGGKSEIRMDDKAGKEEIQIASQKDTTLVTANNKTTSTAANEMKHVKVDATLRAGGNQTVKVTKGYKNTVLRGQTTTVGGNRTVEVNAVYGLTSKGASATTVKGSQVEMDGNPIQALIAVAAQAAKDAARAQARQAMQQLDQAVSARVQQTMGPINALQAQAGQVGAAMNAVSNGDLGASGSALGAAARLPTPDAFAASLAGGGGLAGRAGPGGGGGLVGLAGPGGGGEPAGRMALAGGGEPAGRMALAGGPAPPGGGLPSASRALGIDSLLDRALGARPGEPGSAVGRAGEGGSGASAANVAGPDGAVGSNSASESATGPGHAINVCSATHDETVGSLKAILAAAGIHTTIKGARTHKIGAARVELVGGTRAESCLADKTEKAVGLIVISKGAESETVGGSRSTMVGGAVLEKIGGSCTVAATGKATFVGAFHKIDATSAIVLKCGDSEVVISGGGIAIKTKLCTFTAPNVTLTKSVSEA